MERYKYLIVFNGESDFVLLYTEEQVKEEIIDIIDNGCGTSDIMLFKVEELDFSTQPKDIEISINEEVQ